MKKKLTRILGLYLNTLAFILPRTAGRQGFLLFCRPFRAPLKDYHMKFLQTAEHFSFEHDGVTIQAYRWGNGSKKILFIHGWQSHSFRWKAYIESFSKEEYTLYSIDAPGHGLSKGNFVSVPYYTGVIQQLVGAIGPLHALVSHSLGSFSSLYAFYEQPSLPVNKLVVMASPGEASDFFTFYKRELKLSNKIVTLILDHFKTAVHHPVTFFSAPRFATAVKIPTLIIHDEEDPDASFHYALMIHDAIEKSVLTKTNGIGHNLKSPLIVKEVVDFVNAPENQLSVNGNEKISAGA